jgi:hypothetical protein
MMRPYRLIAAMFASIALCMPVDVRARAGSDHGPTPPNSATSADRCIALPLPSLRGAEGSSTELSTTLRELIASFLTGPSLRTIALEARLTDHAIDEAREKTCSSVLLVTLTRKRSSGGGFGRALGEAAGAAAWHLPYGATATATAARGVAMAGSAAVTSMASNTRAKDELLLEYRLVSDARTVVRDGKDSAKAKADGEDLLTPLVERMATAIAGSAQ